MTMMKRETLEDKRRYIHKMGYGSVDKNDHKQVIDSHIEALDRIAALEGELRHLRDLQNFRLGLEGE